jgi:N6-adenosine-specific RNA methylase IME4
MTTLLAVIPKSVSEAKRALADLERDVDNAETYESIRRIQRVVDAIKTLFYEIDEVRHHAERIIVVANHRIGRELKSAPVAKGARGGGRKAGPRGALVKPRDTAPTLKEQVGSKTRGLRMKRLAALPIEHVKHVVADLQSAGKEATVTGVLKQIDEAGKADRRARRERNLADKILALPAKRYGVILADPEFEFVAYSSGTGINRSPANHYPVSDLETLKARDVRSIAAVDCVLFLWSPPAMIAQALEVMDAWDFEYRSQVIWRKDKAGLGYWFRSWHEVLLVGVGKHGKVPAPAMGTQWPSVIDAPVGEHSAKPEVFLEMIESYFPTLPKIELNRRGPARPGWDAWGNEAEPPALDPTAEEGRMPSASEAAE